jgi:hypothetical protein
MFYPLPIEVSVLFFNTLVTAVSTQSPFWLPDVASALQTEDATSGRLGLKTNKNALQHKNYE